MHIRCRFFIRYFKYTVLSDGEKDKNPYFIFPMDADRFDGISLLIKYGAIKRFSPAKMNTTKLYSQ